MKQQSNRLLELTRQFQEFTQLEDSITTIRPSHDNWTLKEILGHLVDSASNNHQRFIRLQLLESVDFPDYQNTDWIRAGNYGSFPFTDLLNLLVYYNRLMAHIILSASDDALTHVWNVEWDQNGSVTLDDSPAKR